MRTALAVVVALFGVVGAAEAATYRVGTGQPYATLASLPQLQPGDVVEIQPGTYREVKRWTTSGTAAAPITIRGVAGQKPVFDATGINVSGNLPRPRAIFQIEGSHYVIEHVEFKSASNGNNAAGIRITGATVTNTTIRDVYVHHNNMGLQADRNDLLLVESSEFSFNGTPSTSGQQHNVYLDTTKRAAFRFCYIHDASGGINFKSRAHYVELLYSYIADGADAEISLVDSTATTSPYSNAVLIGNTIVSRVRGSRNNQVKYLDFGAESGNSHFGTLYLINNTLIAGTNKIQFLWATNSASFIEATNNVFLGSNVIVGRGSNNVIGRANWVGLTAQVPAGFSDTIQSAAPGFVDGTARDYHLAAGSALIDHGVPPFATDGDGLGTSHAPEWEYVSLMSSVARAVTGAALDIGAYEFK